jgi:tellurite resistance protein TehA-like permease
MERAFRIARTLGQWIMIFGLALAAFGLIGWILSIFHHPQPLLIDLGVLALPAFFLGILFLFIAAIFQRILIRRRSAQPTHPSSPPSVN